MCRRRFQKLRNKEEQWPRECEERIKHLYEVERKSWIEIEMTLQACSQNPLQYKAKKIRERYKNYLEMEVSRKRWSLEEDLRLWGLVSELGKQWKEISPHFPERSCLQIRNRYYKFLEPAAERICR